MLKVSFPEMRVILLLALVQYAICACPEGQLQYWLTNPQNHFNDTDAGQAPGCLTPLSSSNGPQPRIGRVEVDPTQRFQTIQGFGAGLTNSAAYLIHYSELREQLLQTLFSPTEGIGVSYLRLPMGASDFMARGLAYTFDDEYDPELTNFSIESELEFVIPTLLSAKEINPDLKIMACPWTAPPWMKDNNDYDSGSFLSEFTEVYANYFVKYIQGFEENGVHIDTVSLQNEPVLEREYPTMLLSAQQEIDLIKSLGPKLEEAGLDTKIVVWDYDWNTLSYPLEVLGNSDIRPYIDGWANHGYGGDPDVPLAIGSIHPEAKYYFTEFTGTFNVTNWPQVFDYNFGTLFLQQVQNGAVASMLWNIVLDENSGPVYNGTGGWKNCRGTLTLYSDDSHFEKSIEYHGIGHMSKAASSGAVRIGSPRNFGETGTLISAAFENPDESIGVVVYNRNAEEAEDVEVVLDGQSFVLEQLPPLSAVTFRS